MSTSSRTQAPLNLSNSCETSGNFGSIFLSLSLSLPVSVLRALWDRYFFVLKLDVSRNEMSVLIRDFILGYHGSQWSLLLSGSKYIGPCLGLNGQNKAQKLFANVHLRFIMLHPTLFNLYLFFPFCSITDPELLCSSKQSQRSHQWRLLLALRLLQ